MQNTDNQELHKKFEKKQSYFNEMQRISMKFLEFEQLAYYSPLKDINPSMITKLQLSHEGKNGQPSRREEIYVINGQYQPTGSKSFEKLVLQIVQTIPRPKHSFGLIYINTLADSEAYNDFKKVLELLPVQYLLNLTKIYIVEATFLNKAFSCFSFGTNPSYVKNKTINVDTLEQLSYKSQIDLEMIKKNLPKNIIQSFQRRQEPIISSGHKAHGMCMNEPVDYHESRKKLAPCIQPSIVPPGFSRNKSQDLAFDPQQNLYSTSSSTIKLGAEKNKKCLQEYQIGPSGAPVALEMLIYFFNNKQQYLRMEGLFRKSVSIDDETEILKQLNNKNYNYLASVDNPHVIANAIKRFLSNFRDPIIPYDIFQTFMANDNHPQYRLLVTQNIKQLPKTNRMIIFLLFDFLKTSIIPNSETNKMGQNNLCIIFGPVLMRSQVISIKDLIYAKKIIQVASFIFQDFHLIFGDRLAQQKIKRNSYKQYLKTQIQVRSSRQQLTQKQQQLKQPPQFPQGKQESNEQSPITPKFNIIHRTSEFIKEALQSNESDGDELDPQFPQPQPQPQPQPFKIQHSGLDANKQPFQQNATQHHKPVNLFISMTVQNPSHQQNFTISNLTHSEETFMGEERGFL